MSNAPHRATKELRTSRCSELLLAVSKPQRLRRRAMLMAFRLESGPFYSATAREIMRRYFCVNIGAYSYGSCFDHGAFQPGVMVGRYVSIGPGVLAYRRNHPTDWLSTHPFFFNSQVGFASEELPFCPLEIAHDAWIGARVIITPSCTRIGIGSIVGAGAVLTRDVPDFAIVGGIPGRIIRMRFSDILCEQIRQSQWWMRTAEECAAHLSEMMSPLAKVQNHTLLPKLQQAYAN